MSEWVEWERVAKDTWRLALDDGYLFRFGASVVYAPADIRMSPDERARRVAEYKRKSTRQVS